MDRDFDVARLSHLGAVPDGGQRNLRRYIQHQRNLRRSEISRRCTTSGKSAADSARCPMNRFEILGKRGAGKSIGDADSREL